MAPVHLVSSDPASPGARDRNVRTYSMAVRVVPVHLQFCAGVGAWAVGALHASAAALEAAYSDRPHVPHQKMLCVQMFVRAATS
eukprot:1263166-Pyramimonas_sp.AAC.1